MYLFSHLFEFTWSKLSFFFISGEKTNIAEHRNGIPASPSGCLISLISLTSKVTLVNQLQQL